MLGDGDDADAAAAQHGLEGDGVFAFAREARELPDQDLLEGSIVGACRIEHLPELGPVSVAPALRLIDVLASDQVVILLGVVAERAELGGDGEVAHHLAMVKQAPCERRAR